jgi:hypothetical protein
MTLLDWFRRPARMTYSEELEAAIAYCTRRTFATLPDEEQSRGYYSLAAALKEHADGLANAEDAA